MENVGSERESRQANIDLISNVFYIVIVVLFGLGINVLLDWLKAVWPITNPTVYLILAIGLIIGAMVFWFILVRWRMGQIKKNQPHSELFKSKQTSPQGGAQGMNYKASKVGDDERGIICFVENDPSVEVGFQTIHAGKARAGHYHSYEEEFFVISGKAMYISKDAKGSLRDPKVFSAGQTIVTIPNEPHLIWAIEETSLAIFKPKGGQYQPTDDPELRKIMEIIWKGAEPNPTKVNTPAIPPTS